MKDSRDVHFTGREMRFVQEENCPVIQNIKGKVSLKTSLKLKCRVMMAQPTLT